MSALDKQVGGDHYKGYAIQPVEFITQNDLGFLEGCVIKRLCRWQMKDGIKDLRKAIHEIELLIEQTEATEKRFLAERDAREAAAVQLGHPMIGDRLTPAAIDAIKQAFPAKVPESNPEWPLRACTCRFQAAGEEEVFADCRCPPDNAFSDFKNMAPAPSSSCPPIVVPEGAEWPVGVRNGTRILAWRPRRPGDLGARAYGWVEIGFMWDDELVRHDPAS